MNDVSQISSMSDTDRCVKCGLCLPHCPTWQLLGTESDSPRGRISIMQAMASGALTPDAAAQTHLERCTGCLNCERVCPADVPYSKLIDAGRAALVANKRPPSRYERIAARVTSNRVFKRAVLTALALWQKSGLSARSRSSVRFMSQRAGQLERWLPLIQRRPLKRRYAPVDARPIGTVALFTGCLGPDLDNRTLQATIAVLTALGFAVEVPRTQTCCGALWQHAGYPDRAARLAIRNIAAFTANADAIIAPASGCAAMLRDYARVSGNADAASFAARVRDPVSFALDNGLADTPLGDVNVRAVLHHPCTLKNVLHADDNVTKALSRVPGLELQTLPAEPGCCGGAGAYALSQPELADELDARTVQSIRQCNADVTLTSNIGCALSIGRFRDDDPNGESLTVTHPICVLAEAITNGQPV